MKLVLRLCQIILIAVIVISVYQIYHLHLADKQAEERYKNLQQNYTTQSANNEVRPQFTQLEQVNKDIVGWIHLSDSTLNYPVLQAKDNKTYLQHDFEHEASRKGSIFMDYRNAITQPDLNTVIYGHHVGDNTMFDVLEKYLKQSFYDKHKSIQFDTKYHKYRLEVLSAYQTTTKDNYIQTYFKTQQAYDKFLKETMRKSVINTTTEVSAKDKIVTLSTCEDAYSQTSGRIVVVTKLVELK
ncbi:class B sortase [Staphylococcus lugdunensis]|uniref:class B sortase n=1 Tax=Staphylococcus lugdunensis TaxID=28035 RepID=UPI000213A150|nr:class B sortase [Staphylococcus lugdunensis]ARJ08006.1 SrtB family sortase [Staphylococcus lugdunensis]EKS22854.1 SrtB family sortase [Staphylococcus lugdunensis ACS-027-V-Sch2]MCI2760116.1 class B sortase [Staphylococcus lugdunensis]MCI2764252.1 class B sortase [Staphylococcus lugdunensis]MCI2793556.1 class B sortase [Staphylococcus lugdunensis]